MIAASGTHVLGVGGSRNPRERSLQSFKRAGIQRQILPSFCTNLVFFMGEMPVTPFIELTTRRGLFGYCRVLTAQLRPNSKIRGSRRFKSPPHKVAASAAVVTAVSTLTYVEAPYRARAQACLYDGAHGRPCPAKPGKIVPVPADVSPVAQGSTNRLRTRVRRVDITRHV